MSELEPWSTWRHVATGSTYTVIGVSRCSTNGPTEGEMDVVYVSHSYQLMRHRLLTEFMDGRFVRVAPSV